MEGDTNTIVSETAQKMDENLTGVMPSYWDGHARLAIRQSDVVPDSIEDKAIEKAVAIADDKGVTPERAAKSLIKNIAKKRGDN